MTRIDFYVIPGRDADNRQVFACKLAEKAYKLGHRVYIHTDSRDAAAHMDDLLWTFRPGSFVPHAIYPESEHDPDIPVLIGHDTAPERDTDVLVNLTHEVPPFFSRFERVAELVSQSDEQKQRAREHFRFYRDRGYELQTHNL